MARSYNPKTKKILFLFWDTETIGFGGSSVASQICYKYEDDFKNAPLIFEGYDCINETFDHIKIIWESFDKPDIRLYAHNAAFDLMRTKLQLTDSVFKATLVCGQMIAGRLEYSGMTIECRDSLRMLPSSLKKLASSLAPNLPKLDMNHLIGYIQGDKEHIEYALRDVEALREVLLNFASILEIPLEKLKYSTAGQAFSFAKSIYEKETGKYAPLKMELNKIFLKYFYVGGRIYIRNNHSPVELSTTCSLDITSSYPYQMHVQSFPLAGISPRVIKGRPPEGAGRFFVKCFVRGYNAQLPVLPYRTFSADGKKESTIYPHGDFVTYISDIEFLWVKKNQPETDLEVIYSYFWQAKDCDAWLKPYIDKYYKLKQRGDELNNESKGSGDGLREVAKLLLNSIYGKFAQKYIEDDGESVSWNGGDELEIFSKNSHDHRNAHISAFITSGARCHLYDAIVYYGADNVVYSDTDSVKIYKHVYDSMPKMKNEGDELGGWKNEGTYENLQVIAPKVYIGTHYEKGVSKLEIKAKGLPLSGIKHITVDDTECRIFRTESDLKQNELADEKAKKIISEASRSLKDVKVYYSPKPTKLKSFVKTGELSQAVSKTLSYPDTVKGLAYNGNVFRFKRVSEEYNLSTLRKITD